MGLLKNGPSLPLSVLMNWDGPHFKPVEATYLSGLYSPYFTTERPLISQTILNLIC